MAIYEQKFSVDYAFDVYFTRDLFSPKNEILTKVIGDKKKKVLTVIDENLLNNTPGLIDKIDNWFKAHNHIADNIGIETVPGGEVIKNDLEVVDRLGRLSIEKGICRHSYIMVIGGGAVLDAVGYAASIIHRGVRLIRVPTTVLAQNDSAVGVKNGVNRFGVKNFYGVFSVLLRISSQILQVRCIPTWKCQTTCLWTYRPLKIQLVPQIRAYQKILDLT